MFKINLIDFIISIKLLVCAKKLLATTKSNLEYLLTIFLASLKLRGFLMVTMIYIQSQELNGGMNDLQLRSILKLREV